MCITLKDGSIFAFAGLHMEAADGARTCTIITTTPNDLIEPIHIRMR
jgi:putative SOS response-associated peptidase YedK